MRKIFYFFSIILFIITSCKKEEPVQNNDFLPDYHYTDVKSIFENYCVGCHSYGGEAGSSANFSYYSGIAMVVESNPSDFIDRINWINTDSEYRMPPTKKMPLDTINIIERWIELGYPE